jgi:hypothetical protein
MHIDKKQLNNIQEFFFDIFIYLSYLFLFLSLLGISFISPQIFIEVNNYVRIYICLFLMWRFNPLRSQYEFTNLDRKISFSAGLFILSTTALNQYLVNSENVFKRWLMTNQT